MNFVNNYIIRIFALMIGLMWINYPQTAYSIGVALFYSNQSSHINTIEMVSKDIRIIFQSEYDTWVRIKGRCYNKNNAKYERYGGRGIKVCDSWLDKKNGFENFLFDMGVKPENKKSIDRINNNGNYESSNCRWADDFIQANNKSNNYRVTYKGKRYSIKELAVLINMHPKKLKKRLRMGWDVNKAVKNYDANIKIITIDGVSKSVKEWSELYGIKQSIIHTRLFRGWTTKDAVLKPLRK